MNEINFLRVCSDLHFEFRTRRQTILEIIEEVIPPDVRDKVSMLVLAGDITSHWADIPVILEALKPRFVKILYVPGNHEYYGNDIDKWTEFAEALEWKNVAETTSATEIKKAFSIVNQENLRGIVCGRITIWATTLWASGGTSFIEKEAVSSMNDFRCIRKGNQNRMFTIDDMQNLSRRQSTVLEAALNLNPGPKIVVTHHLPSYSLCDPKYSPSPYDGLFASNYNHLLSGEHAPKIWICGHIHYHIDRILGDTRIICNPLGYPDEYGTNYQPRCFVDLSEVT